MFSSAEVKSEVWIWSSFKHTNTHIKAILKTINSFGIL